ncbi:MAG: hypothetical protein ACE363_05515 [Alphaproteobacteria bacterium]
MFWLYWIMIGTALGLLVHMIFSTKPVHGALSSAIVSAIGAVIGGALGRSLMNFTSSESLGIEAMTAVAIGSVSMLMLNFMMAR